MNHDQPQNGEMTEQEAADLVARRLDEHDEQIGRLAKQFAGLQRVRNDLQDLREEVRAAKASGLAAAIGAMAASGEAPTAYEQKIAQTAHEIASAALARVPDHGDVTAAGIGLRHEDGWLTVVVGDNGEREESADEAVAFQRLEARVNALDGHLYRASAPGEGTTLVIGLPSRRAS